jgi:hypothetical protein
VLQLRGVYACSCADRNCCSCCCCCCC